MCAAPGALVAALILLAFPGEGALGQAPPPGGERLRLIQERARRDLAASEYLTLPTASREELAYGGWATVTAIDLKEDDRQPRVPDGVGLILVQDYRLWLRAALGGGHGAYVRARNLGFEFSTVPGVPAPDTRSQEDIQLDLAFFDVVLRRDLRARIGRQFTRVGRGLALSADLDGIGLEYSRSGWRGRLFGGESLRRDPNVDTSVVGFDKGTQKRSFTLAEGQHRTRAGTTYQAYLLVGRDRSGTLSDAQARRPFAYDARYVGLGTDGRLHPKLLYFLEYMHETGDSLVDRPGELRTRVDASGLVSGLLHYAGGRWRPLASVEYALGTGDANRRSVTNAFGGKQDRGPDHNFLYFGAYDGGLALSPRLSNLHVLRVGYQVRPLPKEGLVIPDVLVGAKLSSYWKDEKDGVISDPFATLAAHEVGTGLDAFVAARPLTDLSLLVQYGRFDPGRSYPAATNHPGERVLVATTLTF